jgi:CheY-like chemotaxis protein
MIGTATNREILDSVGVTSESGAMPQPTQSPSEKAQLSAAEPVNRAAETGNDILLHGLTVIVVEDEMMVSLLLEDMLGTLGCDNVMHASSVSSALSELAQSQPDVAILDVNLGSEMVYPVAEQLNRAGVPFVFTTGYGRGAIKLEWAARPCVQKPFNIDAFASALRAALARG